MATSHVGAVRAPVNPTEQDRHVIRLATMLGLTPAKVRLILLGGDSGSASTQYALLFAALALVALAWSDLAVIALDYFAPGGTLTISDSSGPVLCASGLKPSPSGGECF